MSHPLNTGYARGSNARKSKKSGLLDVGNGHQIYYRTSKCQTETPIYAIYIHGGPGSCSSNEHMMYFNTEKYCVVQYDQRGCGKSLPYGERSNNSLTDLVEDIEKLRIHLGITKWVVFGGSWGALIALRYTQKYPSSVQALVSWCCYLGQSWVYAPDGAARQKPEAYSKLTQQTGSTDLKSFYTDLIATSTDEELIPYAQQWVAWESTIMDGTLGRLGGDPHKLVHRFKMFVHFALNDPDILNGIVYQEMTTIPTTVPVYIFHGDMDTALPPSTPHNIKEVIPHAQVTLLENTSHFVDAKGPLWIHHLTCAADQIAAQ